MSTKALTEQFTKSVKVIVGSVQEEVKANAENIKKIQETIKTIEARPFDTDIKKQIDEAIRAAANKSTMDEIEAPDMYDLNERSKVTAENASYDFFWVGAPPSWFPSWEQGRHTNSGLVALSAPRGPTLSGMVYPSPLTIESPVRALNDRLRCGYYL